MKARIEDLAIFGGQPRFGDLLHVGQPHVPNPERLHERIQGMLDRNWLTNDGPLVREFETRIAEFVGTEHCVAMSSGTRAIEVLVRAAGLEGEVIVPSFTFVGTVHPLLWCGLTPRFCDIDPETHTLDPGRVEDLIGDRTSAILGVHLWGRACNVDALTKLADSHGVALHFDAAHAFASSYAQRMVGSLGDAEVFSFHATKVVHAFEGGAVTTDDGDLAQHMRLLRNFGFSDYDNVVVLGTNAKMSEASAAMGLTSLEAVDDAVRTNRRNHERYRARLSSLPGIRLVAPESNEPWNHQYVVVEIDQPRSGLSRDHLHRVLTAEGVLSRRYFYPGVHAMEPYRTLFPDAASALPVTQRVVQRVLCLPTGSAVGSADIDGVCDIIGFAVERSGDVRRRLDA